MITFRPAGSALFFWTRCLPLCSAWRSPLRRRTKSRWPAEPSSPLGWFCGGCRCSRHVLVAWIFRTSRGAWISWKSCFASWSVCFWGSLIFSLHQAICSTQGWGIAAEGEAQFPLMVRLICWRLHLFGWHWSKLTHPSILKPLSFSRCLYFLSLNHSLYYTKLDRWVYSRLLLCHFRFSCSCPWYFLWTDFSSCHTNLGQ